MFPRITRNILQKLQTRNLENSYLEAPPYNPPLHLSGPDTVSLRNSLFVFRNLHLPDQLLVVQGLGRLSAQDVDLTLEDGQLNFALHVLLRLFYAVSHKLTLWTVPETWSKKIHNVLYILYKTQP